MSLAIWNLSPWELLLIVFMCLLIFGAKRLPEMGKSLGTGLKEFKRSLTSINEEEDEDAKKIDETKEKTEV